MTPFVPCRLSGRTVVLTFKHLKQVRRRVSKMSKLTRGRAVCLAAILLMGMGGAAEGQKKKKKEPAPPPEPVVTKLTAGVPSLAALAETPQSQTKGGLRITLVPETYRADVSWTTESREAPPPMFLGMVAMPAPNAVYMETSRSAKFQVTPDHLVFHVQLSNQMPRVFRGSGVAVQFNVAGKVVAVEPSGYGDLTNIILPPRSDQEVVVVGPKIGSIPPSCTVGVFFYDLVTNIDAAGNVTDKQNFEWYFSYQTQVTDEEVRVPAPEKKWVIPR